MANKFADCDTIEEVIGQAVGAGSICWENLEQTGVFQDRLASRFVTDAVTRVRELIVGANIRLPETEEV